MLGVPALTLLPLLWRIEPRLIAFEAVAPQLAAAAAVLAILCLLLGRRWRALLAAALVAWNLVLIWPEISPFGDRAAAAMQNGAAPLKVLSMNLWYANRDPEATRAYLATSGADLIGLVEMTPRLKEQLAALRAVYPYEVDCVGAADPTCEIMLLSKRPLRNPRAGRIAGRYPYVAQAEIDWNGLSIGIAMTHFSWPFMIPGAPVLSATSLPQPIPELPDLPRLSQSVQAANLAAYAPSLPADLIVMGDFNGPSWSADLKALQTATGLKGPGGLLLTWPTWAWPVFRVPIDHVTVRGRLQVTKINAGPDVGSDHLPVEAEIAVKQ